MDDDRTALVTSFDGPISRPIAEEEGPPLLRGFTVAGLVVALVSAALVLVCVYVVELPRPALLAATAGLGCLGGLVVGFANVSGRDSGLINFVRHVLDALVTSLWFGVVLLAANLVGTYTSGPDAVFMAALFAGGLVFSCCSAQPMFRAFTGGGG